jgi:putative ATP-dependent endonuclease of the OLD family
MSCREQGGEVGVQIRELRLWNFRGFGGGDPGVEEFLGEQPAIVGLESETSVFIGRNGAGKSALIQALLRLFGETREERTIQPGDFFVPPGERLESQPKRKMFIEALFSFPELANDKSGEAEQTIPPVFRHMTVDQPGGAPAARLRLEATWELGGTLDGVIEETAYWILAPGSVPFGDVDPVTKRRVSASERGTVVVRYIPASRDVTALTQLTVRTLGRRLMQSVEWSRKAEIDALVAQAATELDAEDALKRVNAAINKCWSQLNTAETGTSAKLSVLAPDLQQIVRAASILLTPSTIGRTMAIDELSDGQRSLFHFALVKALLDLRLGLEAEVRAGNPIPFQPTFASAPALTVFAFEEPENHLSPYFLSRLLTELQSLVSTSRVQGVVTSHSPAIVGRVEPTAIRHVRRNPTTGRSGVARLALPHDTDEAAKFVREAVRAHPELYFARHAIFGEGATEEIALPRIADALGVPMDRSFVAIVPIGGRHIHHFWRLVDQLGIPRTTLLDFDLGRSSGDYRSISLVGTALQKQTPAPSGQAAANAASAASLTRPSDWGGQPMAENLQGWIKHLETLGVFFSAPLDLDMLMLLAFPSAYKKPQPGTRGPQNPDDPARQVEAATSVLGKDGFGPPSYDGAPEASLFPWYSYLFQGSRGKPAVHLGALAELDDVDLALSAPPVLTRLIWHVAASLAAPSA